MYEFEDHWDMFELTRKNIPQWIRNLNTCQCIRVRDPKVWLRANNIPYEVKQRFSLMGDTMELLQDGTAIFTASDLVLIYPRKSK